MGYRARGIMKVVEDAIQLCKLEVDEVKGWRRILVDTLILTLSLTLALALVVAFALIDTKKLTNFSPIGESEKKISGHSSGKGSHSSGKGTGKGIGIGSRGSIRLVKSVFNTINVCHLEGLR